MLEPIYALVKATLGLSFELGLQTVLLLHCPLRLMTVYELQLRIGM
jgi:hypothetical protein